MAAPPPPVHVAAPAVPATPEAPIFVDANDAVVTCTPWLGWAPSAAIGGVPRVALSLSEALCAFAIKCKLDRSPANMAAAAPINVLTLKLQAATWGRILTAVRDNGLTAMTLHNIEELHAYIKGSVPLTILTAADWQPAPALGVGANPAARAASARIRYLSLATVSALEAQSGPLAAAAPFMAICKLAGALGEVSTQAARVVETSNVQSVAEVIRAHSTGGATDAALAFNLRSNVMRAVVPKVFRAHGASPAEQSEEMADGFAYKLSESDRKAVEQKRIDCILPWCGHGLERGARPPHRGAHTSTWRKIPAAIGGRAASCWQHTHITALHGLCFACILCVACILCACIPCGLCFAKPAGPATRPGLARTPRAQPGLARKGLARPIHPQSSETASRTRLYLGYHAQTTRRARPSASASLTRTIPG